MRNKQPNYGLLSNGNGGYMSSACLVTQPYGIAQGQGMKHRFFVSPKPPLPKVARIRYDERSKSQAHALLKIVGFLLCEYGVWLDGTMTLKYLRNIDDSACQSLENWLQTGYRLPPGMLLPTLHASNDMLLADSERAAALAQEDPRRFRWLMNARSRLDRVTFS